MSSHPTLTYQKICTPQFKNDYDELALILAMMGPLSKESKALPILTLYKLREQICEEGLALQRAFYIKAQVLDVNAFGLLSFAALSLSAGTVGVFNALCLPNLITLNRMLLGVASLGSLALCSYTTYMLAKKKHQKIADQAALIEPFNQKLVIIQNMIVLLENHPEN